MKDKEQKTPKQENKKPAKKNKKETAVSENKENINKTTIDESIQFKDFYSVTPPFGNVGIQLEKETGRMLYRVIEPTMNDRERDTLEKLKNMLKEETHLSLATIKNENAIQEYLRNNVRKMIKRFKLSVDSKTIDKFCYYIRRDFLGYGLVDVLVKDQNIEDISCNGVDIPIYVWHRNYESLQTNVSFKSREDLNAFITRLAYRSGRQVSISNPILEGALPEGYRIHVTLEEVSKRGGTFTIRKVRANPFTIIDLINLGTLTTLVAAYLWILVENKRSIIASGATAAGKTGLLNAICTFIPPEMKVVTIEEVRELRLHENWIPMITRPSTQEGMQEVTLFDLLKSSLRQRPDFIIVGEIRGEEAYTLFQSISVGHGGMCTIHAENVEAVEKRLLTKPMNIPPMLIPMMNAVAQLNRTKFREKVVRRITELSEITEEGKFEKLFQWDSRDDSIRLAKSSIKESIVLNRVADSKHISIDEVIEDLERRETILKWIVQNKIEDFDQVAEIIRKYYVNPLEVYNKARFAT